MTTVTTIEATGITLIHKRILDLFCIFSFRAQHLNTPNTQVYFASIFLQS